MKRTLLLQLAAALLASLTSTRADTLAQWNFNSTPPDVSVTTGTTAPSAGSGTASLVGTTTTTFATGDTTNDPALKTDNSGLGTAGYPAATSPNRGGVRFDVDTTGYENISISWYQRNSATASRYGRLQYTVDGSTFTDADVITIAVDSEFTAQTVNLASIPAVPNTPAFGFRIVAEWESAAIGPGGADAYVATKTGSAYSTSGTWRFDMVTVSGTPIAGANTPPSVSSLSSQNIRVNQSTGELPLTVGDVEDPAGALTLDKASSNPGVIPTANIAFGGSGSDRTVNVTAGNQPGSSVITVYVIDTGARSNSTSFTVTVLPANTSPVISAISRTNTTANVAAPAVSFTVSDLETPAGSLTLSAASANTALVPNANIVFGGGESDRTVTVTPADGQTGVAPITVTVSDGANTASSVFAVMVVPSPDVLFYDPFNYGNGSLLTNSGFLWDHRSGTSAGECQVTNGALQVTAAQTEDLSGMLVGAPYLKSSNTVLYAAFKLTALTLPKSTADYFAHFGSGATYRGRIYVSAPTNAAPGSLRLYVSNATDTNTVPAGDLNTNTACTVVLRYNIDAATATLWLNPASESDPGATAADLTNAVSISTFNFRQDSGCGATMLVDDLKVGLSFAAVTGTNIVPNPIALVVERNANNLILTWTDSAFGLQAAPAVPGTYANVPGATSPYTNAIGASPRFFRLKAN
jgi:hypothetical protein